MEAVSLPDSDALVLKRPEVQQGEPVQMAFAGHQFIQTSAVIAMGKPVFTLQ